MLEKSVSDFDLLGWGDPGPTPHGGALATPLGDQPDKPRRGRGRPAHPNSKLVSHSLSEARIRSLDAQANRHELFVAQKRGELIPVAEVERQWTEFVRSVRIGMLALPGLLRDRLRLSDADARVIDETIRTLLTEAARADATEAR